MNVSIDLSQSHRQNIIFIDQSGVNHISTSKDQSIKAQVKKSHQASPITEEEDEHEQVFNKFHNPERRQIELSSKPPASTRPTEFPTIYPSSNKVEEKKTKSRRQSGASHKSENFNHIGNSLNVIPSRGIPEVKTSPEILATPEKPTTEIKENVAVDRMKKKEQELIPSEINEKTITEPKLEIQAERLDTDGTDISAMNLSPKSKAVYKLKKLIKTSFMRTGQAPESTSDFYRIGKVLGRGAFGKVNLTVHRLSQEMVAIKSINKEFLNDEASKDKVMKEVRILKKMRHKNIVQLLDTFETSKHIIFVMELCSGGDLLNYVRKRRKLNEDYAKAMFKQILEALHYCHKKNILHRDIKLDNIILDSQGVVKIGDFGVSKIVEPGQIMYDQ